MNGQKALITGGSSGIGKAIAKSYLELGADVCIVSRKQEKIDEALDEWSSQGLNAIGYAYDVCDERSRVELAEKVASVWGSLSILVNNVGPNFKKHIMDFSLSDYESLMSSNITSAYHLT